MNAQAVRAVRRCTRAVRDDLRETVSCLALAALTVALETSVVVQSVANISRFMVIVVNPSRRLQTPRFSDDLCIEALKASNMPPRSIEGRPEMPSKIRLRIPAITVLVAAWDRN
jgi:hypothetical protein